MVAEEEVFPNEAAVCQYLNNSHDEEVIPSSFFMTQKGMPENNDILTPKSVKQDYDNTISYPITAQTFQH